MADKLKPCPFCDPKLRKTVKLLSYACHVHYYDGNTSAEPDPSPDILAVIRGTTEWRRGQKALELLREYLKLYDACEGMEVVHAAGMHAKEAKALLEEADG